MPLRYIALYASNEHQLYFDLTEFILSHNIVMEDKKSKHKHLVVRICYILLILPMIKIFCLFISLIKHLIFHVAI